jgi:hypothetical protein
MRHLAVVGGLPVAYSPVGGWDRRKEKENCGMKTEIESLNQLVTSLEKLMHGGSGDDVKI